MIIFLGSTPLLIIFIIICAIIFEGLSVVVDILPALFTVIMVKNAIVDIGFGLIKNKKNVFLVTLFLLLDSIRCCLAFYMLYLEASNFNSLFGMIDFAFAFLIVGGLFVVGDFCALCQGVKGNDTNGGCIAASICTILLLVGFYCLVYLS